MYNRVQITDQANRKEIFKAEFEHSEKLSLVHGEHPYLMIEDKYGIHCLYIERGWLVSLTEVRDA